MLDSDTAIGQQVSSSSHLQLIAELPELVKILTVNSKVKYQIILFHLTTKMHLNSLEREDFYFVPK